MLKDSFQQILRNRHLRLVSIAEIMDFGFGEALFYFQAAFFKMVIPEWMIGFVRSFNHLCGAVSFWYAGSIIKFLGYRKTLIGGNLISTCAEYFALFFPTAFSPFMMAATTLTYGPASAARSGLMHKEFSDAQRSTMDSIVSLVGSIFFSLVSTSLGYIADISSPIYAMMWGLTGNIFIIGIYIAIFKNRKHS